MSSHPRATTDQGGDRLLQQPSRPQRPPRQPLGVKNSMSTTSVMNSKKIGTEVSIASEKPYAVKPNQTPHLLPPARIHRPAIASPSPLISGSNVPPTNQRFYTSHQPSPLGMMKGIEGAKSDEKSSEPFQKFQAPLSPSIVKTPKKRAIPLEDIHVRNTVPGQRVDPEALSQSPNPNKRSRSSKHGSSATDPSTSTSLSIATGLGDVNLQSQGGTATAPPISTLSRHQLQNPPLPPLPSLQHNPSHSHLPRTVAHPPHPRPTTTRIDKQSRMTENDRLLREKAKMENQREWRKKFLKAFPQFHFHLDGFDESTRKEATAIIEQLGGTIEPFFSNSVSHLVTTRKIPVGVIPEANTGPLALSLPSAKLGLGDYSTNKTAPAVGLKQSTVTSSARPIASSSRFSRLPALRKKNTSVPLHSDRNPFEECGPPLPANDILNKARSFGIKVWTLEKFRTVMSSLIGNEGSLDNKKQQSLSQMLEKEKVHGTLEKDPLVGRDNFHYFSKNSVYILIEDATAEHRPIMVQEWVKPTPEDEKIDWPVLYGELEGRCPFNKIPFEGDIRKRMKPNRHETLKRSVSLSHLNRRGPPVSPAPSGDSRGSYSINRGASPYPLASGNSVSLTSNIASTTSAMGGPTGLGLIPPYGALGRKVHQAAGLGIGRPSSIASNARSTNSNTNTPTISEQARGSLVRRMLGITDQNRNNLAGMRRSVSTASAGNQLRREKKPGYCENCRSKYDDFDEHIAGRKHRKFAEDGSHFADIDTLLNRVARPIAAWAVDNSAPASIDEQELDTTSTSSLLAAGGSLLEVEGADDEVEIAERRRLLYSPRGFMDAMHQWQQGTQTEQSIAYPVSASLPLSQHHHHYQQHQPDSVTTSVLEGGNLHEYCQEDSTSSHGDQTAGNTTATTVDHQTEEETVQFSPDTSPHVHHQHHHDRHDNHQYHHHHQKQEQKQKQNNEYTASYYGTAM